MVWGIWDAQLVALYEALSADADSSLARITIIRAVVDKRASAICTTSHTILADTLIIHENLIIPAISQRRHIRGRNRCQNRNLHTLSSGRIGLITHPAYTSISSPISIEIIGTALGGGCCLSGRPYWRDCWWDCWLGRDGLGWDCRDVGVGVGVGWFCADHGYASGWAIYGRFLADYGSDSGTNDRT